jgi:hypothetical protein
MLRHLIALSVLAVTLLAQHKAPPENSNARVIAVVPIVTPAAKWHEYSSSTLSRTIPDGVARSIILTWGAKRVFHEEAILSEATFRDVVFFVIHGKLGLMISSRSSAAVCGNLRMPKSSMINCGCPALYT